MEEANRVEMILSRVKAEEQEARNPGESATRGQDCR